MRFEIPTQQGDPKPGGIRPGPDTGHTQVRSVASECDLYGHQYEVREDEYAQAAGRTPTSLFCSRCGLSWKVER